MNREKVRGFFLGTAIGDALGMPVEGQAYERIKARYGRLEEYVSAEEHKWFKGEPLGAWTDDTQLTLAVAEALIEAGGFDMDKQAEYHVKAYQRHTSGWGGTTKEAIQRLANGTHWKESGVFLPAGLVRDAGSGADGGAGGGAGGLKKPKTRGFGNGVCMKVGPVGVFMALQAVGLEELTGRLADFAAMTHRTSMAVSSGLAHALAVCRCMTSTPDNFSAPALIDAVVRASEAGRRYFSETLADDLTGRFQSLRTVTENSTTEEFIQSFGAGSYYVYNSLPFTYAFFVRAPTRIESLYECASAGGDTDSNASMLGGLMGALCGTSIFPKKLVDGLHNRAAVLQVADQFSERFGL
jgi:ADP-ribosylglycohydrolase